MSKKALIIILAAIVASAIAAHVAGRMHSNAAWLAFGVPPFLFSGWAFAGHLTTLDDDAPDGFSNVDGSRSFWRSSLIELLAKGVLFLFVAVVDFRRLVKSLRCSPHNEAGHRSENALSVFPASSYRSLRYKHVATEGAVFTQPGAKP